MKTNTLDYLNQSLIDAIELAKSTGTNAVDFVKEQAPDVVNQLIAWEIASNAIWVAVGLLGLAVSVWVFRKGCKQWGDDDKIESSTGCVVGGLFAIAGSAILFCTHIEGLIKPIIAPKVWLIEYAANLLK